MTTTSQERLINITEVGEMLGRGRASIYRDLDAGVLPKPVRVGSSVRWPLSEIIAHIEALKAARDGEAA